MSKSSRASAAYAISRCFASKARATFGCDLNDLIQSEVRCSSPARVTLMKRFGWFFCLSILANIAEEERNFSHEMYISPLVRTANGIGIQRAQIPMHFMCGWQRIKDGWHKTMPFGILAIIENMNCLKPIRIVARRRSLQVTLHGLVTTAGTVGRSQTRRQKLGTTLEALFDYLYHSMSAVTSFGRTAKFDYLTMIGKLGLAPIRPGSPYLAGATGPLRGARLLVDGSAESSMRATALEPIICELGNDLGVGMQEMEDALCNWQKSQNKFIPFRG